MIRAEEYSLAQRRCVLVGSSLSAGLPADRLGPDIYSLSFAGGSPLSGLEIICGARPLPEVVIIETNTIVVDTDDELVGRTMNPALRDLRRCLPALRSRYEPANFFASEMCLHLIRPGLDAAEDLMRYARRRVMSAPRGAGPLSGGTDSDLRLQLVANSRATYRVPPDVSRLQERIGALGRLVGVLNAGGCRCIFLEMPIDSSLEQLPRARDIRNQLQNRFPPSAYPWIMPARGTDYGTADGLHLTAAEAVSFAAVVRAAAESNMRRGP